jgi:hypothetical protein
MEDVLCIFICPENKRNPIHIQDAKEQYEDNHGGCNAAGHFTPIAVLNFFGSLNRFIISVRI